MCGLATVRAINNRGFLTATKTGSRSLHFKNTPPRDAASMLIAQSGVIRVPQGPSSRAKVGPKLDTWQLHLNTRHWPSITTITLFRADDFTSDFHRDIFKMCGLASLRKFLRDYCWMNDFKPELDDWRFLQNNLPSDSPDCWEARHLVRTGTSPPPGSAREKNRACDVYRVWLQRLVLGEVFLGSFSVCRWTVHAPLNPWDKKKNNRCGNFLLLATNAVYYLWTLR